MSLNQNEILQASQEVQQEIQADSQNNIGQSINDKDMSLQIPLNQ